MFKFISKAKDWPIDASVVAVGTLTAVAMSMEAWILIKYYQYKKGL